MTSSSSLVTPSDTLHGLLVEITNTDNNDNDNTTTTERLCQIAHSTSDNTKNKPTKKNKKRTWIELQDAAGILQQQIPSTTTATSSSLESNALAVSLVFGALSIMQRQNQSSGSAKAAASAFSSTILRNEPLQDVGRSVSALLLQSYIRNAFDNVDNYINFDLNILSHLAKSFRLTEESVEPSDTATVVRKALIQSQQHLTNNDDDEKVADETKQIISGALALANQLRPWSDLSPMELIDAAVAYDYYHAAEEICKTAYNCTAAITVSEASKNGCDMNDDNRNVYSASQQRINVRYAVERLIDTAMEDRSYRLADSLATSLYDMEVNHAISRRNGSQSFERDRGRSTRFSTFTAIGFSCKQDLSRLRASPCVHQQQEVSGHWMAGTRAVVDLQTLVRDAEPSLRKTGLSRACEHYLSKPLDKSEQCSLWSGRPLSERQRSYASLDAWVCVGVYNKLEC
ncbi:hypothetical protein FRACYDRAFT_248563 [Fragilariopsis cylindrus CCMP1102]|uniref:3'-5' exonuclease domain-containing protein n=1 Tax=Fragilariopsis cylindrus CCMP1102 TaxID=635003 RepID=A0A1E7ET80_9STRA|nr:hypothetical protein FRACYDRAFT_248563 [Fragilariopsis cylindrus CCMP1102]|eukprot:OEU09228.1 hypothetical protein FRACYDRAFT_248563 [Fragilariopsis cylindrus CCMP1102]